MKMLRIHLDLGQTMQIIIGKYLTTFKVPISLFFFAIMLNLLRTDSDEISFLTHILETLKQFFDFFVLHHFIK